MNTVIIRNIVKVAWYAVVSVLWLSACSDPPGAPPEAEQQAVIQHPALRVQRVLENYEVGANVYVRALTIEPATNSLWVGTSAGVNQIDLDTHDVLNTFTRDDGLANEYVFGIGIDHDGYKWFGTNAGGVSRYRDGDWKTFFPMHGLADYWVYTFTTQADGTLWIGTWAGANSVDPETGVFTTYIDELVNEWVYGLGVDSKDRVWFATEGGVSMFDGKNWKSWTHDDGLGAPNTGSLPASKNTGLGTRTRHDLGMMSGGLPTYNPSYVFSLHVAPDDTIWAGTWGGGVSRFDGQRWKNLTRDDGLANNIVYSIVQDADGVLWFGTANGISRYDGSSWHTYDRKDGLLGDHVYALAVAPSGEIWAGTKGGVTRIGRQD